MASLVGQLAEKKSKITKIGPSNLTQDTLGFGMSNERTEAPDYLPSPKRTAPTIKAARLYGHGLLNVLLDAQRVLETTTDQSTKEALERTYESRYDTMTGASNILGEDYDDIWTD